VVVDVAHAALMDILSEQVQVHQKPALLGGQRRITLMPTFCFEAFENTDLVSWTGSVALLVRRLEVESGIIYDLDDPWGHGVVVACGAPSISLWCFYPVHFIILPCLPSLILSCEC